MRLILLLVVLLQATLSHAQNSFAPLGAEWWHSSRMHVGWAQEQINCNFHTRSVRDTTIDGIACRKVTTEIDYVANAAGEYLRPQARNYFFYDNMDTAFVYNDNFGRFTPIYVFNAQAGDTICLPVPPGDNPDLRVNPISGDTSFCFVVDSIRLVQYDTTMLRTYYTTAIIGNYTFPAYSWGSVNYPETDNGGDGPVPHGKYTERIIGVFFPRRIYGAIDAINFPYAPYGAIRCYSDATYSLKMYPGACDTLYPLGINMLQEARNILKLYPNPADNQLTLLLDKPLNDDLEVTITDVSGRVLEQTLLPGQSLRRTIATDKWAEGLYLIRFRAADQVYYDKIVIRHRTGQ